MKNLFALCAFLPLTVLAQTEGVHFEHGLTWNEVVAKAKAEHKYIFMDCYTTWCGPCKYMSNVIFPKAEVGDYFNAHFISVKTQLDTSTADNDEVKKNYAAAHLINTTYKVNVYPTFLFFDENGKPVHRMAGGGEAAEFIERSKLALDAKHQYYTLLNAYENGSHDTASLHTLILAAKDAYQLETASKVANDYFKQQKDLLTKDNLSLMQLLTMKSTDMGFDFFTKNTQKADAVLGDGAAEATVNNIILQEEVFPRLSNDPSVSINWNDIDKTVEKKYPAQKDEVVARAKVIWYQYVKDWPQFQTAVVAYMDKYGNHVQPGDLNSYAWNIFENCSDEACINKALEWSKKSFEQTNDPAFMDTYANILYKLGRKDEAITWETKAMLLVDDNNKPSYQETIDKMKSGEKTWN